MHTLILENFTQIGRITFLEETSVIISSVDRKTKEVFFQWDFGMEGIAQIGSFLSRDKKGIKDTVIAHCQFHLAHAFFHDPCDPNYDEYHWALKGNYKDRIRAEEESEEEIEELIREAQAIAQKNSSPIKP